MKKLFFGGLVLLLMFFNGAAFSQQDAFTKFGISDRFRNYKEKAKEISTKRFSKEELCGEMSELLESAPGDIFTRSYDFERDGFFEVVELYCIPFQQPFLYFFDKNNNHQYDEKETLFDAFPDGFSGNEIPLRKPFSLDLERCGKKI
jgi:hypothetical protein